MKIVSRLVIALLCLVCPRLFAANLKVNLAPASAVSGGAQWRVDSGSWRNSGTTVSGLSNGSHTVDFKAVAGWITPAAQTANLSGGTTTLSATYVQSAGLKITLNPTAAQWRIDGGAWQASAVTLTGLTPGNHTINYGAVSGYATPADEVVTLVAGQTTSLTRSYIQLAQLKITLAPTTAHWRVDSGAWQASGAIVSNLAPGSHTVSYAALAGYTAPASENVSLTSGQLLALNRSYVQLAQLSVTLAPTTAQWRVDSGAWQASGATVTNLSPGSHTLDYAALAGYTAPTSEAVSLAAGQSLALNRSYVQLAQLSVTLAPTTAQWRVDSGAWQASGATVTNLSPGSHTLDYAALAGYTAPTSEAVSLAAGQSLALNRSYVQLAQLSVTLAPTTAQWRVDSGAWQASGATVSDLSPGSHQVDYSAVAAFAAPTTESVSLSSGQALALSRSYVPLAQLTINLTPGGPWRIDGGTWQNPGATVTGLSVGNHTIDYTDIGGIYEPLPSETVTLALQDNVALSRSYQLQPAGLQVSLTPSTAMWRASQNQYSSGWQASGATITGLRSSNYQIEYSAVANHLAPATETVAVTPGQTLTLNRAYTPLAILTVVLNPSAAQWRIDGGAWLSSSATLSDLAVGAHNIEFGPATGFVTPLAETVTLTAGLNPSLERRYTPLASLSVSLPRTDAQWRLDSGSWHYGYETLSNLALGTHSLEFSDVTGYITPAAMTVNLASGSNAVVGPNYIQLANLSISLSRTDARWRLDSGPWHYGYETLTNLPLGRHSIEFSDVVGYITPASTTLNLTSGYNSIIGPTYIQLANLSISLSRTDAQWRLDGGPWHYGYETVANLSLGQHSIDFSDVLGYITPAPMTVNLVSGYNSLIGPTYIQLANLSVSLSRTDAQWRIDSGSWHYGYETVTNLPLGQHSIDFSPVSGYITPASITVNLVSSYNSIIGPSYIQLANLSVSLSRTDAQWRLDTGAWHYGYETLSNVSLGQHSVTFSDVAGYITPAPLTVNLVSGFNSIIGPNYLQLASLSVSVPHPDMQWRIDGGAWHYGYETVSFLSLGEHLVEFSNVSGVVTPAPITVNLVGGFNSISASAPPQPATFSVTYNRAPYGQWRLDGGIWHNSTDSLYDVPLGTHTVDFGMVPGYITPASVTVNLTGGYYSLVAPSYTQLANFFVSYNQSPYGQWRMDGGAWHSSTDSLYDLPLGAHTVDFGFVPGYITPASVTVNLTSGYNSLVAPAYVQLANLSVTYNRSPYGQWRLDGGSWHSSNDFLYDLSLGTHTVDFAPVPGYITPASVAINLTSGYNSLLAPAYIQLANFSVTYNRSPYGQWRMDAGIWHMSNEFLYDLALGTHTIDFSPVPGYITPASVTVNLTSGYNSLLAPAYVQLANFSVNFNRSPYGQWRIDGGPWHTSSDFVYDLTLGTHAIDFSPVPGYITPASVTVTLGSGYNSLLAPDYVQLANLYVTYNQPPYAQWRVDGGLWHNSSDFLYDLSLGGHLIEFADVPGYLTPNPVQISLTSGYNSIVAPTYIQIATAPAQ